MNLKIHPLWILACLGGLAFPSTGAGQAGWKAGAAKAVITPAEPVWMAGYAGRDGPSDGALTDIHARVLALADSGNRRLVMVSLELIEIPATLRARLIRKARDSHGLGPDELLLNVSHTHGGPMLSAATIADWGVDAAWGARAEAYADLVAARVDAAIAQALARMAPAAVSHSKARCGFAMNRRQRGPSGFRLGPNPDGAVDHEVPVLSVGAPGKPPLALVFGYACHNTALGPTRKINGDYAGFAMQQLEKDHPETVALFLAGCGGDQDPAPRRDEADARFNGRSLAMAVEAALAAGPAPLAPSLAVSVATCPLPFAPLPPRAEIEARARSGNGFVSRHARNILARWPNPGDQPDDFPLPVQVANLGGNLLLVALGGEPMADYALRLRRELAAPGRAVWVAGYSNLVSCYVPTRKVLEEGGYEGTEAVIYQSLPGPFRAEIEESIIATALRQAAATSRNR